MLLLLITARLAGCSADSPPYQIPPRVDMLFREDQSWETGGGTSQLTLWADGRSQIKVVPARHLMLGPEPLQASEGWTRERAGTGLHFLRQDIFPVEVARKKFESALRAGIHLLETSEPDYRDGGGVLVGVRIQGKVREASIAFGGESVEFGQVAKILSQFDKKAYTVGKQSR